MRIRTLSEAKKILSEKTIFRIEEIDNINLGIFCEDQPDAIISSPKEFEIIDITNEILNDTKTFENLYREET